MEQALKWVHEGQTASRAERHKMKQARLVDLVAYAKTHSPYFEQLYKGVGSDFVLTDLPVTTKQMLMPHFNEWVTDPAITEDAVNHYMDHKENMGRLFLEKYSVVTTSGTSGLPLTMVRDTFHNLVHGALMKMRFFGEVDAGLMNPEKYRIASVIAVGSYASSYTSFERARNAAPAFADHMLAISILLPVDEIVRQLNAYRPDFLTGYPSVLAALALERIKGNLTIDPKAIACSAEQLTREAFITMKQAFGCPVLNNYCSTEGGEAAMMCAYGNLHVNDDWVIMEPVDENDRPVAPGELSSAVLITTLTSFAQPVIRYRLEDRVRITSEPCACGSSLPVMEIMGREGDTICLCGKPIPSVVLQVLMYKVSGTLAFQFAQTGPDTLELRARLMEGVDPVEFAETMTRAVCKLLQENGCTNAVFTISDEPPRNSGRGGKLKTVCKEWIESID